MGRPRIKIDWDVVDKLLHIQCSGEEIAGFLDLSYDTLERRCKIDKQKSYADYSLIKRGRGKTSLRRKQWLMADTHPVMAIFLGKQHLGQADKMHQEVTGRDGKPIASNETVIKVEYCEKKPNP